MFKAIQMTNHFAVVVFCRFHGMHNHKSHLVHQDEATAGSEVSKTQLL